MEREIVNLRVKDLFSHPANKEIYGGLDDDGTFQDLVENIKANGLLDPIIVDQDNFVISGNRRLTACSLLKKELIPAEVIEFESEAQRIRWLISFNRHRVKTELQKAREAQVYQSMLQALIRTDEKERTEQDRAVMDEIGKNRGKVVTRDEAGKAVGLSPRSVQTGKKVIAGIENLEKEGKKALAAKVKKKAATSLSGALNIINDESKPVTKDDPSKQVYWYVDTLKNLARAMEAQATNIEKQFNSKTPTSLIHMASNIRAMKVRIESWYPSNMEDCPFCNGTRFNKGRPCDVCVQGKVGLYRIPDHVTLTEDERPYCADCGKAIEDDPDAEMVDGAMICGSCRLESTDEPLEM